MTNSESPPGPRGKPRVVRVGGREVLTHGVERQTFGDLYHYAMSASWPRFFLGFAVTFFSVNMVFATLYWLGDAPVANARPGFEDLFYFSIETLATVGYGDMHPQTRYGHIIATTEIFTGMSLIAVMTGLVFSRFARPRARVVFADAPVVGMHDGKQTLMLRLANQRYNMIGGATAKLWLIRVEETLEGARLRRVRDLALERHENPMFVLTWTIYHVIDEKSPLFGATAEDLARVDAIIAVNFSGLDESSRQSMHARRDYSHEALRWGHQYVDVLHGDDDGRTHIDYSKFHLTREEPR